MKKEMNVTITCTLVAEDQYYLNGTRLAFDYPWAIYIVNGDRSIPYYRIYINEKLVGFTNYEYEAYNYLLKLTMEQAHDPSEKKEEK